SSYIDSSNNAATSSEEDSNANVTIKNVANLNSEVYKNLNRRLQRMWMKNKLKELYPDSDIYKQYEKDLNHHIIYSHDEASFSVPTNYCEAVTLYPLLLKGTSTMDGLKTVPPKNLNSFCGQLVNLTFLLAAQCKGAVAFGEFFNFLDYFCVKEWGENYTEILDEIVYSDICNSKKTVKQVILQAFQNIVYSWNQPAGNRGFQSPFINISYYDSNYWKALFEDFCFPDGSKPKWERVSVLQKLFMKWFNAERKKTLMTFPVETMALLTDGKDVIDKEYKDFTAEMWAEGHSFFLYLSDNPDGLSSCCRLKNKIGENEFSFTNGLSGVKTGSCNVITLNLNRIIQDWARFNFNHNEDVVEIWNNAPNNYKKAARESLVDYLKEILERVYKYQIAYKTILYEEEEKGMLTASKAGYISMKDLFSTIGINGINEAAEFLGIKCNYNKDYKEFCRLITGTISEQNKLHSTPSFKFNQEFVPKRSGHIKPLLIDLKLLIIGQQGASKEEFCAA
ncbi:MAG: anaerobic ribonucleoside-triphosphate reductase, partial [Clostridium sp.]|nr:anaerobic ribonucleoside-triphosphate reductase [Clostridium sp.]